jgi:hypothetical protein
MLARHHSVQYSRPLCPCLTRDRGAQLDHARRSPHEMRTAARCAVTPPSSGAPGGAVSFVLMGLRPAVSARRRIEGGPFKGMKLMSSVFPVGEVAQWYCMKANEY